MQRKIRILHAGVALLLFLLVCTVVSSVFEQAMLPEIATVPSDREVSERFPSTGRSLGAPAGKSGTLVEWRVPPAAVSFTEENSTLIFSFGGQPLTAEASLLPTRKNADGSTVQQAVLQTERPLPTGSAVGVLCETLPQTSTYSDVSTIPASCVQTDEHGTTFVFNVTEEKGVWGNELRVHRNDTRVVAYGAGKVTITNQSLKFAAYPSRPLRDGERVREATP